jgi:hypothetical protein
MQPETSYNPESPPAPGEWLQLPEHERVRIVATYHMVHRLKSGSAKAHAALHAIVENQAATGFGPTVRALARLQRQGLSRHEAVHAVGSIVSGFMFAAMNSPSQPDSHALQSAINSRIEALDAQSWRKEYGA